jgi:hypothetical protein
MKLFFPILFPMLAAHLFSANLDFSKYAPLKEYVIFDSLRNESCSDLIYRNTDYEVLALFGKYQIVLKNKSGLGFVLETALMANGNLVFDANFIGKPYCVEKNALVLIHFSDGDSLLLRSGNIHNCENRVSIYEPYEDNSFDKLFSKTISKIKVNALRDSLELPVPEQKAKIFRIMLKCLNNIKSESNTL